MSPYRKLKVLSNDLQKGLEFHEKYSKKGLGGHWEEEFDLFTHYPDHEVVFSRVGFYKLGDDIWYEFKRSDGSYKAIDYKGTWFNFILDTLIADECPIEEKEWLMIKHLLKKGVLKQNKRFRDEEYRRDRKDTELRSKRDLKSLRSRIKARIKEKENEFPN